MSTAWRSFRRQHRNVNRNTKPLTHQQPPNEKEPYHFVVARVYHGAVDVELVDNVWRLVPPALSDRPLGIHLITFPQKYGYKTRKERGGWGANGGGSRLFVREPCVVTEEHRHHNGQHIKTQISHDEKMRRIINSFKPWIQYCQVRQPCDVKSKRQSSTLSFE